MSEKHRLVVFSDSHTASKRDLRGIGTFAKQVEADGIVFAGDHDLYPGFRAIEKLADIAILGNHCYCWGSLAQGRVKNIPDTYRRLADPHPWEDPSEEILSLSSRFKVKHLFQRIHFRHALSPYMVGQSGVDDEEFTLDWGRDFLPAKYLGERFWATPESKTMTGGSLTRKEVMQRVFEHIRSQGQRLLVTGHEHRSAAIEFIDREGNLVESRLSRGNTHQDIPEGSRLRLPPFFRHNEAVVLDIWEDRVDAVLSKVSRPR